MLLSQSVPNGINMLTANTLLLYGVHRAGIITSIIRYLYMLHEKHHIVNMRDMTLFI